MTDFTWEPGEQERFDALRALAKSEGMTLLARQHAGRPGRPQYLLRTADGDIGDFDLNVIADAIENQTRRKTP